MESKALLSFHDYLLEARAHAEKNPKISVVNLLEPYATGGDAKQYYITFTEINKVGVNPHTEWNTPIGVYAYPLKYVWHDVTHNTIPFAKNAPFISVLKRKSGKMLDYRATDQEAEDAFNLLEEKFKFLELKERGFKTKKSFFVNKKYAKNPRNAFAKIWNLTMNVALILVKHNKIRAKKDIMAWTYLMHDVLGYMGAEDLQGDGIIHPHEPIQTVFFSTSAFSVVKTFDNKRRGYDDSSEETFFKNQTDIITQYGKVTGSYQFKSTDVFSNMGMNAKYIKVDAKDYELVIKYAYVENLNFKSEGGKRVVFENCIVNNSNLSGCELEMCFVTNTVKSDMDMNNCIPVYKNLNEFLKNYSQNKLSKFTYFDSPSSNYGHFKGSADELHFPFFIGGVQNGKMDLHGNNSLFVRNLQDSIMFGVATNPVAKIIYGEHLLWDYEYKVKAVKLAFKFASQNGISLKYYGQVFDVMGRDDFLEFLVANKMVDKFALENAKASAQ